MASNAEIRADITTATDLGITSTEMVALIDRAIAELTHTGKPQASYAIAGRNIVFANLQTLSGLRDYYLNARSGGASKYVSQYAEF